MERLNMKKPKIKKCKNYWLVYTDKKSAFKCFNYDTVELYYNLLLMESGKQ